MLTLTQARQFAGSRLTGHYHGGQGSALYSFCSTGGFHFPLCAYLDELNALPEKADASLLADYLRHTYPLPDGGGLWLDVLTIRNTAFDSFAELVFARGGYYPSLSRMQSDVATRAGRGGAAPWKSRGETPAGTAIDIAAIAEKEGLTPNANWYMEVKIGDLEADEVWFDELEIKESFVTQENHYYPFCMNMTGIEKLGQPDHKFQFQGIERNQSFDLNWDETDFRRYDSQLGRLIGVDALSEQLTSISPFQYSLNNPILFNDPTGLSPEYIYEDGNYYRVKNNGKKKKVSWESVQEYLSSNSRATINTEQGVSGFIQGVNSDPNKLHIFNSEEEGIAFMLGVSFADKSPDENGFVTSPEVSAWMVIDEEYNEEKLVVMPWNRNNNQRSYNDYFTVFSQKEDPYILLDFKVHTVIGHIHTHPNFYKKYEGPSWPDSDSKGDFQMTAIGVPKYVIGRTEISRFMFSTPNDNKRVFNHKTKSYKNFFLLTKTSNIKNGFSFFEDAKRLLGIY
jgi:RHS repeat-associated protein